MLTVDEELMTNIRTENDQFSHLETRPSYPSHLSSWRSKPRNQPYIKDSSFLTIKILLPDPPRGATKLT